MNSIVLLERFRYFFIKVPVRSDEQLITIYIYIYCVGLLCRRRCWKSCPPAVSMRTTAVRWATGFCFLSDHFDLKGGALYFVTETIILRSFPASSENDIVAIFDISLKRTLFAFISVHLAFILPLYLSFYLYFSSFFRIFPFFSSFSHPPPPSQMTLIDSPPLFSYK